MYTIEFFTTKNSFVGNARITSVKTTKSGFRVQMFNPYVILYYLKIVTYKNGFKIHWLAKKNYQPDNRFTAYYFDGKEISKSEFYKMNK